MIRDVTCVLVNLLFFLFEFTLRIPTYINTCTCHSTQVRAEVLERLIIIAISRNSSFLCSGGFYTWMY